MKIASIDIGSNTVLMLIAEIKADKEICTIKNFYRMPRLAKGLDEAGIISDKKLEEFYAVLKEYKEELTKENCDIVLVNATAAMRNAKNSPLIIDDVKQKFGFEINLINGKTEAEYSFLGATSTENNISNENIVVDIGGASTEVVLGDKNGIKYSKSFEIGAVKLTDKIIKNDPTSEVEIIKLNEYVNEIFIELRNRFNNDVSAIAVAGTPTTLSCMKQGIKDYNDKNVEGSSLSKNDLVKLIDEMKGKTAYQILEDYGEVVKGRNDVILAGSIILKNLLEILNLSKITVSSRGIRYGAVIDYLRKVNL